MNEFSIQPAKGPIYFVAVGDVHDHFNRMEELLVAWSQRHNLPLSFILQVGDLQAVRDEVDLQSVATPQKYLVLGDFHLRWQAGRVFPWPIYFIGGNHEPFAWLDQYPDGSELMPGLHYLGRAGQVTLAGLRIAGLTGIHSLLREGVPRPPVDQILNRSRKHYTFHNYRDVERVMDFERADILLLHEWPRGVLVDEPESRWKDRLRGKPVIAEFGSEQGRLLIDALRPSLVLCGHMHMPHECVIRQVDGWETRVVCLPAVPDTDDAVRFFRVSAGKMEEMPL
jgi:Icc-related predicted phosphoesterase